MSDVRCKYFNGTVNPEEAKADKPYIPRKSV